MICLKAIPTVVFLLSYFGCQNLSSAINCPFSRSGIGYSYTCQCLGGDGQYVFDSAYCYVDDDNGPMWTSPVGAYTINGAFIVQSNNIYKLRPQAFSMFLSIGRLTLQEATAGNAPAFDPTAFQNVKQLASITLDSMKNLIPVPEALRNLGKYGLQGLQIVNVEGLNVTLGDNEFTDFRNLSSLAIDRTIINSISDIAFSGLEDRLVELSLTAAALIKYPSFAVTRLVQLQRLNLSRNNMSVFPKAAFAHFTYLDELRLSTNNLKGPIGDGTFDNLPPSIRFLYLDDCTLIEVPTNVLAKTPRLMTLTLANNFITAIKSGDFPLLDKLINLNLQGNPITTIEIGSMEHLPSVREILLQNTNLESIDISALNGSNSLTNLVLDNNAYLKTINISSLNEVPPNIKRISVINTVLEIVDSKFDSVLSRSNFDKLDLTNNTQIICDQSMHWMAKHVFCRDVRLLLDRTHCGNLEDKLVKDYLSESVENPCLTTTAVSTSTIPIITTTAQISSSTQQTTAAKK